MGCRSAWFKALIVAVCLFAGVLVGAGPAAAYVRPGTTERVSVPTAGLDSPGGGQNHSSVSDEGRFAAFVSARNDLVRDDRNGLDDVFVRDRMLGTTVRASVTSKGTEGVVPDLPVTVLFGGIQPSISGSGRYVAFVSKSQLESADKDALTDVYVHDLQSGRTERISSPLAADKITTDQRGVFGSASSPSISRTGRYVVFESEFTDLVKDDHPGRNVFLHDRKSHTTEYICCSKSDDDGPLPDAVTSLLSSNDGATKDPAVTPNGRYVAFETTVDGVVPGDTNGLSDVYVFDRNSGKVKWVSESSALFSERSEGANVALGGRSISADGRFVVFHTLRRGYVPTVTTLPIVQDTYVRDLRTGRIERVSVTSAGAEHDWGGATATISGNGRFVAFSTRSALSERDRPPPPGLSGGNDIYVHDRDTGATELLSISTRGDVADDCSNGLQASILPSISHTGRYVSFSSCADNLDSGDTNGSYDNFVRDRGEVQAVGSLTDGVTRRPQDEPPDDRICASPDICIPPGRSTSSRPRAVDLEAPLGNGLATVGGRATTIRIVHRPATRDLYLRVNLAPGTDLSTGQAMSPAAFGGVRLSIGDQTYVVGYIGSLRGALALLRCEEICRQQAMIEGGYGTTGVAVTMSLPLDLLGLGGGGTIERVEVLSISDPPEKVVPSSSDPHKP